MRDQEIEKTAAERGWDQRTVARLRDAAHTVMNLRMFREHTHEMLGSEAGRLPRLIQREGEAYLWPTLHHAESLLAEHGADAGQSGGDGHALWVGLTQAWGRVPDAPKDAVVSDDTALLLRMLHETEAKHAALHDVKTIPSPFLTAARRAVSEDIASLKAQVFDAMRSQIEAAEGSGR